mgnify:CR=1 FL=1
MDTHGIILIFLEELERNWCESTILPLRSFNPSTPYLKAGVRSLTTRPLCLCCPLICWSNQQLLELQEQKNKDRQQVLSAERWCLKELEARGHGRSGGGRARARGGRPATLDVQLILHRRHADLVPTHPCFLLPLAMESSGHAHHLEKTKCLTKICSVLNFW